MHHDLRHKEIRAEVSPHRFCMSVMIFSALTGLDVEEDGYGQYISIVFCCCAESCPESLEIIVKDSDPNFAYRARRNSSVVLDWCIVKEV